MVHRLLDRILLRRRAVQRLVLRQPLLRQTRLGRHYARVAREFPRRQALGVIPGMLLAQEAPFPAGLAELLPEPAAPAFDLFEAAPTQSLAFESQVAEPHPQPAAPSLRQVPSQALPGTDRTPSADIPRPQSAQSRAQGPAAPINAPRPQPGQAASEEPVVSAPSVSPGSQTSQPTHNAGAAPVSAPQTSAQPEASAVPADETAAVRSPRPRRGRVVELPVAPEVARSIAAAAGDVLPTAVPASQPVESVPIVSAEPASVESRPEAAAPPAESIPRAEPAAPVTAPAASQQTRSTASRPQASPAAVPQPAPRTRPPTPQEWARRLFGLPPEQSEETALAAALPAIETGIPAQDAQTGASEERDGSNAAEDPAAISDLPEPSEARSAREPISTDSVEMPDGQAPINQAAADSELHRPVPDRAAIAPDVTPSSLHRPVQDRAAMAPEATPAAPPGPAGRANRDEAGPEQHPEQQTVHSAPVSRVDRSDPIANTPARVSAPEIPGSRETGARADSDGPGVESAEPLTEQRAASTDFSQEEASGPVSIPQSPTTAAPSANDLQPGAASQREESARPVEMVQSRRRPQATQPRQPSAAAEKAWRPGDSYPESPFAGTDAEAAAQSPVRNIDTWARLLFEATRGQAAAPPVATPAALADAPTTQAETASGGEGTVLPASGSRVSPAAGTQRTPARAATTQAALPQATPLRETTRRFLRPIVGIDPGDVQIYRGSEASQVTAALGADGVSVGDAIALGPGHEDESRPETLGLLAHELTHTARRRDVRFVAPIPGVQQALPAAADEEAIARAIETQTIRAARRADPIQGNLPAGAAAPLPGPGAQSNPGRDPATEAYWGDLPAPWEPMPAWFTDGAPSASDGAPTPGMAMGQPAPVAASQSLAAPVPAASPGSVPIAAQAAAQAATAAYLAEEARGVSEGEQPAAPQEEETAQAAPDIDALARQVYDVLKHRLAAERRRLG
jgi:hypothetical protein